MQIKVIIGTGIYSSRIRLQEDEEKVQAEEKNERLLIKYGISSASEELEYILPAVNIKEDVYKISIIHCIGS